MRRTSGTEPSTGSLRQNASTPPPAPEPAPPPAPPVLRAEEVDDEGLFDHPQADRLFAIAWSCGDGDTDDLHLVQYWATELKTLL